MKAIVLAADQGFEIEGINEKLPKALLEIDGKPMIEYVLKAIDFIDKKDITIVVGYEKEKIINKFGNEYNYANQKDYLGTGHAVHRVDLDSFLEDEDILICYCDMPLITKDVYKGIVDNHLRTKADCTVLTAIAPKSLLKYGRIIRKNNNFAGIVEFKDTTEEEKMINELNVGIYMFKNNKLIPKLENLLSVEKKKYPLTHIPKDILDDGGKVETFSLTNTNLIYGINNEDQLSLCREIVKHSKKAVINTNKQKWFGTGGWRSIIGEDFTKDNLQLLVQAISEYMLKREKSSIVIGYDRRFLSDKASMWAAEVFAANNIDVFYIGRIAPTPLVMFTVTNIKSDLGLSITASHNPADYNGVKVFLSDGSDAPIEITDEFEKIMADGVVVKAISFDSGIKDGIIHVIDPNNDYIDSIINIIDMNAIRKGNLRILLDPMFGVSKTTLQTILMTARADVDIINDRHDTLFGGQLPSPTEESLAKLRNMVVQQKYDLGIGTDGDADRVGIVDNMGRFVHPNEVLILLYHYMLKYKNQRGDCVRNLATSHLLDVIAKKYGQKCYEVPVGFKNISSKMNETNALIGGESSGGLTIRGHIKGKDGIFASALVAEMICVTEKTIPELLVEIEKEYGSMKYVEFEASFTDDQKEDLLDRLMVKKQLPEYNYPIEKVSYMDGCKVYFENNGWIIARFSGTEPLIRIFSEMPKEKMAREVVDIMVDFLKL